jgi:hypothetical protein
MESRDKERLGTVIDRKLAGIALSAALPPAWSEAWSRLGPQSTGEERLRVCQAIRDSGSLPEAAGYFLVSWKAEDLAAEAGVKNRDPLHSLNAFEARRTADRVFAETLERHGEGRMARLFHTDPEGHARLRESGRQFFFGAEETEAVEDAGWLADLLRTVADGITAAVPVDALEYWHRREWDSSEVHVRSALPGNRGWALDVERLGAAFDRVDAVGWYASPAGQGGPPYCWIEGTFQGRDAFLRVLADASQVAEPGESYKVWKRE